MSCLPRNFWSERGLSSAYTDGWRARMAGYSWEAAKRICPSLRQLQCFQCGFEDADRNVLEREIHMSSVTTSSGI